MKLVIPKGATSRIVTVFIQDSSSTTGAGLGSLDQTSSITGGFVREGSTGVALAVDEDVTTEGTYQAPSAQGKVRIGTPANMPTGFYELHFHNNLWATGAETVTVGLGGASNMAPLTLEIQLSDPVRGLGSPTALPNAAADAPGGLPISDAGGLDLDNRMPSATATTNLNTVFATDFATNYDATNDRWTVNVKTWNNLTTVALPLTPTVAGRALDVTAAGNAGIDWGNIESPTGAAPNVNVTVIGGETVSIVSIGVGVAVNQHLGGTGPAALSTTALTIVLDTDEIQQKLAGTGDVTLASLTVSGATTLTGAVSATNASNDVRGIGSFTTAGKAELQQECTDAITAASIGVKKNTQLAGFAFLMVDSSDNPATGLTVTATRSIDGAAFGACANSVAEISNGIYKITLAAADVNGDVITLKFTASGAKARYVTIKTTNP